MDTYEHREKQVHRLALARAPGGFLSRSREGSARTVSVKTVLLSLVLALPGAGWAQDTLVLTQSPHEPRSSTPKSVTDARYPAGTRVVASKAPFAPDHAVVLSQGLLAAGSPVVSYDGRQVVFAGKLSANSEWQIYETRVTGGRPRPLTQFPGGATHPALLANSSVIFAGRAATAAGAIAAPPAQLYVQTPGEKPRQLTFGLAGASDPTLLLDGRILFVSAQPAENKTSASMQRTGTALYTINNDGTELTAFACQHDPPALLCSPRQLNNGRVAFLSAEEAGSEPVGENELNRKCAGLTAETVRLARPFASRARLLDDSGKSQPTNIPGFRVLSVEPCGTSNLLICGAGPNTDSRFCVYRVTNETRSLGTPLIAHASYDTIEAVEAAPSTPPMGRISTMEPSKKSGLIICLDVNNTTLGSANSPPPKAVRVRLLAGTGAGAPRVLGEVDAQADGSFMAEVPNDVPLGFEALDERGQVVRREAPNLWVRSGENRACVGCHAAHNQAPHNHRPLAVRVPVPNFCQPPPTNVVTQVLK